MRAVRNSLGFGCRRGSCRVELVIVVGKHGCWPPEDYFALGSRSAAPCSVEKVPCCFPIGVNARKSTALGLPHDGTAFESHPGSQLSDGRLGTKMLRSSKTLQPQSKGYSPPRACVNQSAILKPPQISTFSITFALALSWLRCQFLNSLRAPTSLSLAGLHLARRGRQALATRKSLRLSCDLRGSAAMPPRHAPFLVYS